MHNNVHLKIAQLGPVDAVPKSQLLRKLRRENHKIKTCCAVAELVQGQAE